MDDISKPVYIGIFDRVLVKKVVRRKLYSSFFNGVRIFARPKSLFGLLQDRSAILDDKI